MRRLILSRFLQAIPTLWVIATLTFFMTRFAPGGPFDSEKVIPQEIKAKLESHFGLDRPLFENLLGAPSQLHRRRLLRSNTLSGALDEIYQIDSD